MAKKSNDKPRLIVIGILKNNYIEEYSRTKYLQFSNNAILDLLSIASTNVPTIGLITRSLTVLMLTPQHSTSYLILSSRRSYNVTTNNNLVRLLRDLLA